MTPTPSPQPPSPEKHSVLLLAHGGPDRLEDLPEFLTNVRNGRPAPPELLREITRRYSLIGGRSPLKEITLRQAQALQRVLGCGWRVYVGMRNWRPFIHVAVAEIARDGVRRLVCLCMAPQNSSLSVGLYRKRLQEAEARAGLDIPIHFIESWHSHPLLIQAFAGLLREKMAALEGQNYAVVFTAHSLPERILAAADPYDGQVKETVAEVAARAQPPHWVFAYQSQGTTEEKWLGPTVEETLEDLRRRGFESILVAPIGFVADHVEVLYDIDIGFQEHARRLGLRLARTESLNDCPEFIAALAAVVRAKLASDPAPDPRPPAPVL